MSETTLSAPASSSSPWLAKQRLQNHSSSSIARFVSDSWAYASRVVINSIAFYCMLVYILHWQAVTLIVSLQLTYTVPQKSSGESFKQLLWKPRGNMLKCAFMLQGGPKKKAANFCPYRRQILTDFHFFHRHILW